MEVRSAKVTVRVVLPEMVPLAAVIREKPAPTEVANPLLVIVATAMWDELHVTWSLISKLVPSENVPMAINCWVIPAGALGMLGLAGLRNMEIRFAGVTLTIVIPEMFPEAAVMVAIPKPIPKTKPVLSTVATELLDELHVTWFEISDLVPSPNIPVAVSCPVKPRGMSGLVGETEMEERVAEVTVSVVLPTVFP